MAHSVVFPPSLLIRLFFIPVLTGYITMTLLLMAVNKTCKIFTCLFLYMSALPSGGGALEKNYLNIMKVS